VNFLSRLAATALGEARALRPALPAPYAAGVAAEQESFPEAIPPDEPHAVTRIVTSAGVVDRHARFGDSREATTPVRAPMENKPRESAETQSKITPEIRTADALRTHAPINEQVARQAHSEPLAKSEPRLPPTAATARPISAAPVDNPRKDPRRERPVVRAAPPLDPVIVETHRERANAAPPVIHVTIDRIDVRAPSRAPPRNEKPAPARPVPAQSLAEYLRTGSR
jgi:hypothetical protein